MVLLPEKQDVKDCGKTRVKEPVFALSSLHLISFSLNHLKMLFSMTFTSTNIAISQNVCGLFSVFKKIMRLFSENVTF